MNCEICKCEMTEEKHKFVLKRDEGDVSFDICEHCHEELCKTTTMDLTLLSASMEKRHGIDGSHGCEVI